MTSLTAEEAHLQRDIEFLMNAQDYSEISALSWEAAIQKQIEQELYPSSVEVSWDYLIYLSIFMPSLSFFFFSFF